MTNKLEEKIQEIEGKVPGMAKKVESYKGATWGMHWNAGIQDINYIETSDYQVVAARWNDHSWDEGGGGIKWTDWITIYYKRKEGEDEIKSIKTEEVVTRDQYDPKKDRTDLWGYNNVSLEKIENNKVRTSWTNNDGKEALAYIVNPDDNSINKDYIKR